MPPIIYLPAGSAIARRTCVWADKADARWGPSRTTCKHNRANALPGAPLMCLSPDALSPLDHERVLPCLHLPASRRLLSILHFLRAFRKHLAAKRSRYTRTRWQHCAAAPLFPATSSGTITINHGTTSRLTFGALGRQHTLNLRFLTFCLTDEDAPSQQAGQAGRAYGMGWLRRRTHASRVAPHTTLLHLLPPHCTGGGSRDGSRHHRRRHLFV